MSWMIARNRSGWLNCRFHMNSSRYSGMLSYRVPFIRLSFRFTALQRPSTVLVCTPVKGSTKFSEWFTVRWKYPWLCSVRYGVNSSECIVVPGKMWRCIVGSSVWSLRFGTLKSMTSFVTRSIPPKTQGPSPNRPRWYFCLCPNLDSLISTTWPGPPILIRLVAIFFEQTERSAFSIFRTVVLDNPDICWILWLASSCD